MNLRKLKNQAGFTLVELIVVIAIMAILAGVAVPVYSGYIEKANKAADLQLLGAVNSAFGAAVIENGSAPQKLSGAGAILDADKKITSVSASADNVDLSKVNESFERYFSGNEDSAFKVIEGLGFSKKTFTFVDVATLDGDDIITMSYGNGYVTISGAQVQAIANSSFVNSENGVADLLDQVDWVTGVAADLTDGAFGEYLYGTLFSMYGITNPEDPEQMAVLNALVADKIALMKTDADILAEKENAALNPDFVEEDWWYNQAMNQIAANNAVLEAAKGSVNMDTDTFLNNLSTNGMSADDFKSFLEDGDDSAKALSDAAAAYGMYTAYVNTLSGDAKTNAQNNLGNLADVLNETDGINSAAFRDWLKTDQAKTDMNAYKSAMDAINNSSSSDAVDDLLVNGFADQALKDLLTQAIGK